MVRSLILLIAILMLGCTPETKKSGSSSRALSTETGDIDFDKWKSAKLVWEDNFEGSELDTTKWLHEYMDKPWFNEEWQHYTKGDNVEVRDGKLVITAKLEGEGQNIGDYTSARLNSKQSFTYGRMEIRAKMPELKGNGLWPAIWMLGDNIKEIGWPDCGEIDIMEYVSFDPGNVHFTIHSRANNHIDKTHLTSGAIDFGNVEDEFHNYGILWEEEAIHFYFDEIENIQYSVRRPQEYDQENWPFDKPHYFLLNLAIGGIWGGLEGVDDTIFPSEFLIDYVRVYQLD